MQSGLQPGAHLLAEPAEAVRQRIHPRARLARPAAASVLLLLLLLEAHEVLVPLQQRLVLLLQPRLLLPQLRQRRLHRRQLLRRRRRHGRRGGGSAAACGCRLLARAVWGRRTRSGLAGAGLGGGGGGGAAAGTAAQQVRHLALLVHLRGWWRWRRGQRGTCSLLAQCQLEARKRARTKRTSCVFHSSSCSRWFCCTSCSCARIRSRSAWIRSASLASGSGYTCRRCAHRGWGRTPVLRAALGKTVSRMWWRPTQPREAASVALSPACAPAP